MGSSIIVHILGGDGALGPVHCNERALVDGGHRRICWRGGSTSTIMTGGTAFLRTAFLAFFISASSAIDLARRVARSSSTEMHLWLITIASFRPYKYAKIKDERRKEIHERQ